MSFEHIDLPLTAGPRAAPVTNPTADPIIRLDQPFPVRGPRPRLDWRLRSRTLALGEQTLLMVIVNLTPDSFSGDGLLGDRPAAATSRHQTAGIPPAAGILPAGGIPQAAGISPAAGAKLATAAAVAAVDAGADIVDLGAESTRPNATPITEEAEQRRLLPVLEGLLFARPQAIVSVDTYHAGTARLAARAGAEIINDVSGLTWDPAMADAVAATGCGLVLMHTRGRPREWLAQGPMTSDEVIPSVFSGLCERLVLAESAGIATDCIVADPGFGFGKRGSENMSLLAGLSRLHQLGRPLLIGLSRKGFLGDTVSAVQPPAAAVQSDLASLRGTATVAANVAAVLAGAHILRVHDLQAAREAAAVADAVLNASA